MSGRVGVIRGSRRWRAADGSGGRWWTSRQCETQPGVSASRAGEAQGLRIAREVFADRNYLSDGWLVPRNRADALLTDPVEAAKRVLRMLREGKVQSVEGNDINVRAETICVHGDTPGAVEFARELRSQLEHHGVRISAPQSSL